MNEYSRLLMYAYARVYYMRLHERVFMITTQVCFKQNQRVRASLSNYCMYVYECMRACKKMQWRHEGGSGGGGVNVPGRPRNGGAERAKKIEK